MPTPEQIQRRGRWSLLVGTLTIAALVLGILGSGALGSGSPTISSDKADYAPGELVTLTGSGWDAGESVHITVNDDEGQTWSRNVDVTADDQGNIIDQFNLPDWFVATYSVTATGATSGTVSYSFTDSNPQTISVAPASVSVAQGNTANYTVTVAVGGNTDPCNVTLSASGLPAGATATFSPNPVVTEGGQNGNKTSALSITTTGHTPTGSFTITVSGASSGAGCQGPGATPGSATLVVTSGCTAPTVTTNPTDQSVTYGANASFTAAANGTAPVGVQWQVSTDNGSTWNNLPSETNTNLTLTKPTVAMSGNKYRAVFSNGCGTKETTAATLTVSKKTLLVDADNQSRTYGDADPAATWTYSGFVSDENAENVTINGSATCSYAAHSENVGTYVDVISCGPGSLTAANYDFAAGAKGDLTITKATLSVDADNQSRTYGDADPAATFSLSGFKFGENATSAGVTGSAACVYAAHSENVGTYVDVLSCGPGSLTAANYDFAAGAKGDLTITKATLTVTADDKSKVYDGDPFTTLTSTITGFKFSDDESVVSGVVSYTGSAIGAVNADTYTITPVVTLLFATNYDFTPASGTLTITKRPITVKADAKSKPFGAPDPPLTYQITSGSLVSDDSFSGALTRVPGEAVGTYAILQGTLTAGSNYELTYVGANLTIGAWNATGFYPPVGVENSIFTAAPGLPPTTNPGEAWNTVKGGSTVPLKFNVYAGGVEKTALTDIQSFQQQKLASCAGSASNEPIEEIVDTGNTDLRYDTTGHQWIQNWKTPKVSSETCYRAWVTFKDGSSLEAFFKLRK